jgi:hypothetical protein
MPVGDYNKDYFLLSGLSQLKNRLKKFNPNADIDEYGLSTKILRRYTPQSVVRRPLQPLPNDNTPIKHTNQDDENPAWKAVNLAKNINPAFGVIASAPNMAMELWNFEQRLPYQVLSDANAMRAYNLLSNAQAYAKPLEVVGKASNVVGGVLSGASLAKDIYDMAKGNGDTFDNSMKIIDDAGGVVSAAVSAINPVAGLAVTAVEKLGTGIARGAKAVMDLKKQEGSDYKPSEGLVAFMDANVPDWWSIQIGSPEWHEYWKNRRLQKKQAKQEKKAEKNKKLDDAVQQVLKKAPSVANKINTNIDALKSKVTVIQHKLADRMMGAPNEKTRRYFN